MAFRLGQAIVEFRAKGVNDVTAAAYRATRGLKDMTRAATGVGLALSAGAITGAAVAMVKLAANTEVTKTQFAVLLKDMDAAERLLGEITTLAASTPFQKMELADAGRMMLAFGIAAEDVVKELRMIGDISALTGNSIGEIAELYGKAKVQGRLFAEDINQLTGRGIPIIDALASTMGYAKDEIKGIVSEGKVGFPELQRAMQSLTAEGGMFAGGMERLSETTAGKLSTLKDQFTEIGVTIGTQLLPAVTELVNYLSTNLGPTGELTMTIKSLISDLGDAVALAKNIKSGLFEGDGFWDWLNRPLVDFNQIQADELAKLQREQDAANDALRNKFGAKPAGRPPAAVPPRAEIIQPPAAAAASAAAVSVTAATERAMSSSTFGFADLSRNVQQSALSNKQIQLAEETNQRLGDVVETQQETNAILKDGVKMGDMILRLG